jgi:hypothetical protein
MERTPCDAGVIELAVASSATRGQDIPVKPESEGFRLMGLIED